MRLETVYKMKDLTLEELVDELVEARANLKRQEEAVYYIERAILEGMEERGATVVKTPTGEATKTVPVTYDNNVLARLREITSPDDLVGYWPQQEVVKVQPERWNMTQAKVLGKLSHEHQAIIEDAKIYGNPRIKFTERKGDR